MTITSPQNPKLKLVRSLRTPRGRKKEGLFATEGEDLLEAGLSAGHQPTFVLCAAEEDGSDPAGAPQGVQHAEAVEATLLDEVSELGSGTRVIAVWPIPKAFPVAEREPIWIYLDGVGDPANVGAIIRSVAALVKGTVVLGPGTADPYGPKAVRATMGSIFSIRVTHDTLNGAPDPVIGLAAHGGDPLPGDGGLPGGIDPERGLTLCLGSEREGLSSEVLGSCQSLITIPLPGGGAESLNVAASAAILLQRISSAVTAIRDQSDA